MFSKRFKNGWKIIQKLSFKYPFFSFLWHFKGQLRSARISRLQQGLVGNLNVGRCLDRQEASEIIGRRRWLSPTNTACSCIIIIINIITTPATLFKETGIMLFILVPCLHVFLSPFPLSSSLIVLLFLISSSKASTQRFSFRRGRSADELREEPDLDEIQTLSTVCHLLGHFISPSLPPSSPSSFFAPITIFPKHFLSLSPPPFGWLPSPSLLLSLLFRVILSSAVYPSASSVPPSFPDRHNRVDFFGLFFAWRRGAWWEWGG